MKKIHIFDVDPGIRYLSVTMENCEREVLVSPLKAWFDRYQFRNKTIPYETFQQFSKTLKSSSQSAMRSSSHVAFNVEK